MSFPRRLAAVALTASFLLGVAACGSSGASDSSSDDKATTTAADGGSGDATTTAADSGSGDTAQGTGKVTLADGEAPADKTFTFTSDGGFDPTSLEVNVGELFTVKNGGDGVNAVKFGDSSDTYTITGGLIESFTIDAPGTYTMTEDLTSKTATITVTA
ncbi:cupredoxin domain-containing protein [Aquihabitans sp. McL0605]|uniref:cupredoxin domain-containing protein n=1 Tax=Aquihabitans sp. McL0605 TaxID=3415671 RepID=UPI003CF81BDA